MKPLTFMILVFVVLNIVSFIQFGIDKNKARRGAWRISEMSLMLTAILGGSIGALLGMYTFRHKTKHALFVVGIPVIIVIQAVVLGIIVF